MVKNSEYTQKGIQSIQSPFPMLPVLMALKKSPF